jgi:C-6 monooxygenase
MRSAYVITDSGFYSIIDYTVDGFDTQHELVEAFAEIQERWVRFYPGYRSARFHVSTDGTRVYNIVHWDSEADYRNFVETSDTEGRMAAIRKALEGLSGKAEPRMSGVPTYTVVREVGPGPQRLGS